MQREREREREMYRERERERERNTSILGSGNEKKFFFKKNSLTKPLSEKKHTFFSLSSQSRLRQSC